MGQHVSFHPITHDLVATYRYYLGDAQGPALAEQHCDAVSMNAADKGRFVSLLNHFAAPGPYPFDQTHGLNLALTQGFFGPYFYINDASFSALGDVAADYWQPWQQFAPDWEPTATAQNTILSEYSSGRYLPAAKVATFMEHAHSTPELTAALGSTFGGAKLDVLWAALEAARAQGAGLLEASGVIEPNATDLSASVYYSRFDLCDANSLARYCEAHSTAPAVAELPVPRHLEQKVVPVAGARLPTTPSLTERLRAKRDSDNTTATTNNKA